MKAEYTRDFADRKYFLCVWSPPYSDRRGSGIITKRRVRARDLHKTMEKPGMITVELYGLPRLRAGRAELKVWANTLAELLSGVQLACPGLADLLDEDGRLASHYLLSIEGAAFISDKQQPIEPGTRVLILSADAGG
jgi:molybdopterin synthase sulfur carrier subunit